MGKRIVIISNTQYSNLGIGYIAASLESKGFTTAFIDSRLNNSVILSRVRKNDPLLIGFSVTSHNGTLDRFIELAAFLRNGNINCHFTAGGHYASLNIPETFEFIPELDSIVLFEGEYTISELAKSLNSGLEWQHLKGIAFRKENRVFINEYRPLEKDLDKFPYPKRRITEGFSFEIASATLLAGRGCINKCRFCNEGVFYKIPGGPLKRIRKPENVVKEIKMLYNRRKCRIFLFADDDFPASSGWAEAFCAELIKENLYGKIIWKMCCRADEIEEARIRSMKEHGLFLVFLGLEDGTDSGLRKLNKNISASENYRSIEILKKHEIGVEIGFMLFQPYTTFESLNENLNFLGSIASDGYFPLTWLKLMPHYCTDVEAELKSTGRLIQYTGTSDYEFTEDWLNEYYLFVEGTFGEWLRSDNGLANISMWINNSFMTYSRFYGNDEVFIKLRNRYRKISGESNLFMLNTMKTLSYYFKSGEYLVTTNNIPQNSGKDIRFKHDYYLNKLRGIMNLLYTHVFDMECKMLIV